MNVFFQILRYDLLLAYRQRGECIQPLLFFIIVVSLFPLVVGANQVLLKTIAPGIIWIAALLSMLLALPHLFRYDFLDGSLEQLLLSPKPLALLVFAKVVAYWLITALPLILLTPILASWLFLPMQSIWVLCLSLWLGTPVFSILGATLVALMVSLRQGSLLLALLLLPLVVPILIFGVGSVMVVGNGMMYQAQLAFLGAILAVALTAGPIVIAAALRVGCI